MAESIFSWEPRYRSNTFFFNPVERANKLSRDQWVDIDGSRVTKLPRKHKCQQRNMCVPSPFPSWALGRTNLFLCYRKLLTVAPPHSSSIPNCLPFFSPAVILNSFSENSFMRPALRFWPERLSHHERNVQNVTFTQHVLPSLSCKKN